MKTSSLSEANGKDAALVTPGQILAGKFRVERVIGAGGMGIVVEATHLALDQRVAIKFLREDARLLPDVVARFDREARSAVKLKSEHVARVIDVGKTEDGTPFMVMEYLEGQDLAQRILAGGALPIAEAVEYVIQACEGVGEAHAKGIVHRDLKPENLFLVDHHGGWKQVKVLDFGISKAALTGNASSVDMSVSATTSIMGSPYYMSPEQLRSTKSVDHRADVWSLGVVLFELVTGTTPFDESLEFTELVAEILESPHRRLREFRPDAPEALERVVDKAMSKDRAKRFQNTAELAIALLPFAPSRARVSAERTTSVSRAAGLLSDPSIGLPPSVAPPALEGDRSSQPMVVPAIPASRVPNLGTPDAPQSQPSLSTNPPVETMAPRSETLRRKKPPVVAVFFGALLLLGIGGALAAIVIRTLTPAAAGTGSASVATQEHPAVPLATTAPPIVDTASASATASVATKPSAKPTATQLKWTPPLTKPPSSATVTTKPTGPSLDISHER